MVFKKLSEVADIFLSSVDKKINDKEKNVKLCNFTDVYYNFDLDKNDSKKFMIATANENEIAKFKLQKDDVVITKDSETRDDIGISCHIKDDFDELVLLGYHCALIRPRNNIDGAYLNVCLQSKMTRTYFSNQASGSGQRYTLTEKGIGDVKIPYFGKDIQKSISRLISNINQKIRINSRINDNLQQLAEKYFDYWFLQYEFPSSNNKPYKSNNNMFSYNDLLKTNIPQGWEVINIRKLCDLIWGQCPNGENILPLNTKETEAMLYCSGAGDMRNGIVVDPQAKTNCSRREAQPNDILMSVAGSIGALCICDKTISLGRAAVAFRPKTKHIAYCYFIIKKFINRMLSVSSGSIQKVVNDSHIDDMNFPYNEEIVSKFDFANQIIQKCIKLVQENNELINLRNELLPLLMNGQVSII